MKKVLVSLVILITKIICTPLVAIIGWCEILIALIMWDKKWMETEDKWRMLWHN